MTTPQDIAGAQEALAHVGIDTIDERILADVLTDNPDLVGTAHSWGWTDTEVRDGIAQAVCRRILDLSEREYLDRLRADERGLTVEMMAAHDRWVAANPKPKPTVVSSECMMPREDDVHGACIDPACQCCCH